MYVCLPSVRDLCVEQNMMATVSAGLNPEPDLPTQTGNKQEAALSSDLHWPLSCVCSKRGGRMMMLKWEQNKERTKSLTWLKWWTWAAWSSPGWKKLQEVKNTEREHARGHLQLFSSSIYVLKNKHTECGLTGEDDQQQAGGVQLDVWVTEGVAEGGVDDHQEDDAADGAERGFSPLQKLPEETPTHLPTRIHEDVNHVVRTNPIGFVFNKWRVLPDPGSEEPPRSWRAERRWRWRGRRMTSRAGGAEPAGDQFNDFHQKKNRDYIELVL